MLYPDTLQIDDVHSVRNGRVSSVQSSTEGLHELFSVFAGQEDG